MKRLRFLTCLFAVCAALAVPASYAQDGSAHVARLLASACANCHGTDGRSQGGMPALAGLSKVYIVRQMQDFKSGKRVATIMHQLAKGYTDDEIDAMATYFSTVRR